MNDKTKPKRIELPGGWYWESHIHVEGIGTLYEPDGTVRVSNVSVIFAQAFVAAAMNTPSPAPVRTAEVLKCFRYLIRQYWSFDESQQHTHSWHDRESFIVERLPELIAQLEAATVTPGKDAEVTILEAAKGIQDRAELMMTGFTSQLQSIVSLCGTIRAALEADSRAQAVPVQGDEECARELAERCTADGEAWTFDQKRAVGILARRRQSAQAEVAALDGKLELIEGGLECLRMGIAAEESRTDSTFRVNDLLKDVQRLRQALAASGKGGADHG